MSIDSNDDDLTWCVLYTIDGIMICWFVTPVTICPANEIEFVPRLCLPCADLFSELMLPFTPPLIPL